MDMKTYSTGSGSLAASASSFCSLACLRLQRTQTESEFKAQSHFSFSHPSTYSRWNLSIWSGSALQKQRTRSAPRTLNMKGTRKTEWNLLFTCCPSRSRRSACWPPAPSQPSTAKPALGCPPWSSSASPPGRRKRSAGRRTRPSASGSPSPGPAEDSAGEAWRLTLHWHTGRPWIWLPVRGLRLKTWDQLPSFSSSSLAWHSMMLDSVRCLSSHSLQDLHTDSAMSHPVWLSGVSTSTGAQLEHYGGRICWEPEGRQRGLWVIRPFTNHHWPLQ